MKLTLQTSSLVLGFAIFCSSAGASAGAGADAAALAKQQQLQQQAQQQLQQQAQQQLNNQKLSAQQALKANFNVSPTNSQVSTNGTTVGGNQLFYFNPASLPTVSATPGSFSFTTEGGLSILCPTPAHGSSVSVYVAAWNHSTSSGQVTPFCVELTRWAQKVNMRDEIRALFVNLTPEQRSADAQALIDNLGLELGLTFPAAVTTGNADQTTRVETKFIYVPYQPEGGKDQPPVRSRN